eukprot:UN27741
MRSSNESMTRLANEVEDYSKKSAFSPSALKRFDELFHTDLGYRELNDEETDFSLCHGEAYSEGPDSTRSNNQGYPKSKVLRSLAGEDMNTSHISQSDKTELSMLGDITTPFAACEPVDDHSTPSVKSSNLTVTAYNSITARNTVFN